MKMLPAINKHKKICIILFALLTLTCQTQKDILRLNEQIYDFKGYNEPGKKRLKPIILYLPESIYGITGINKHV